MLLFWIVIALRETEEVGLLEMENAFISGCDTTISRHAKMKEEKQVSIQVFERD